MNILIWPKSKPSSRDLYEIAMGFAVLLVAALTLIAVLYLAGD
jgi:hypothetical protein